MRLRLRAIFPSRKSVMLATQKKNRASVLRNGICHGQNSAQRKNAVSTKRETVSLFGRFIAEKLRAELVEHLRVGLHEAHQEF